MKKFFNVITMCFTLLLISGCSEKEDIPVSIMVNNTQAYVMDDTGLVEVIFNVNPKDADVSGVVCGFDGSSGSSNDPNMALVLPDILTVKKSQTVPGQWAVEIGLINAGGKRFVPKVGYQYNMAWDLVLMMDRSQSATFKVRFNKD